MEENILPLRDQLAQGVAAVFFVCAPIVLAVGFARYNKTNKRMNRIMEHKENA